MEVAGLSLGYVKVFLGFIQQTDSIIRALEQWRNSSEEAAELLSEVRVLTGILLTARDLAEREGTEDANVQTLTMLAQQGQSLRELLDELNKLEFRPVKSASGTLWYRQNPDWFSRMVHKVRIKRQGFDIVLSISRELPPNHDLDQISVGSMPSFEPLAKSIAEWLNGPDFSQILEQLMSQCMADSDLWLVENSLFQQWMDDSGKSLWCPGPAGTGKSVLSAMAIDFLKRKHAAARTAVIYAFFDFRVDRLSPDDITKSLISQLVRQFPDVSDTLSKVYEKHKSASTAPKLDELWSCLLSEIGRFDRVFIFFDALDRHYQGVEGFMYDFRPLLRVSNVSLFVTSRPMLLDTSALRDFDVLEIRAPDWYIERYVWERISQSWLADLSQQSLQDGIVQNTVQRADGEFLRAALILDSLISNPTVEQVQHELSTNPNSSVDDLYKTEIMKYICNQGNAFAKALEILVWLTYSLRPLTIHQLRDALLIRLGDDDLNEDELRFIDTVGELRTDLRFLTVSAEQVSLAHYTLKEYLQNLLPDVMSFLPGPDEPEAFVAQKCLVYLSSRAFSFHVPSGREELDQWIAQHPMMDYAAKHWGEHARRNLSAGVMVNIMALFRSNHNTSCAGLVLSTNEEHPSHYEQAYRGMLGLHISACFGLKNVVEHIINVQKVHPDVTTNGGWTALHWASRQGWEDMVANLLFNHATPSKTTVLDGWNALHLAAKEGHQDVVTTLISAGVDINAKDVYSRTPLYLATWAGHTHVVQCLLKGGANPNIPNVFGATALHCAAKRRQDFTASQLISKNIDVNAVDKVGLTALDEAIRKQDDKIIEILIQAGAQARWNASVTTSESTTYGLDWSTYIVNEERARKIQRGRQCTCHVLEKSVKTDPLSASMAFRKTFPLSADGQGLARRYLQSERTILHRLRHPNVVSYLDFDEDPDQNAFLLYMEYCDLGDLETCYGRPVNTESVNDQQPHNQNDDDYDDESVNEENKQYGFYAEDHSMEREKSALDSESVWNMISQLSLALAYLHYGLTINHRDGHWEASFEPSWQTVIHRDIKPANVVMQSCDSHARIFKLCDLGIASEAGRGPEHNQTQFIGSQGFWPPEVNRGNHWSTKGDIWSLGETVREVRKLKVPELDDLIKGIIDKCANSLSSRRPNSLDILQEAYNVLETNSFLKDLPPPFRLQIQAVHRLLGNCEGGYILKAFNLVVGLLDGVVSFKTQADKDHRKGIVERLNLLWKDGAKAPFLKHLNEHSLHVLVVLQLSSKNRTNYMKKAFATGGINAQWGKSLWTPLHLARQEGNKEIEEFLLQNGADRGMKDRHGYTPEHYIG